MLKVLSGAFCICSHNQGACLGQSIDACLGAYAADRVQTRDLMLALPLQWLGRISVLKLWVCTPPALAKGVIHFPDFADVECEAVHPRKPGSPMIDRAWQSSRIRHSLTARLHDMDMI